MNLSIIIAHYCTDKSSSHYASFLETLNKIKKQTPKNYKIEIIIADDGSYYSSSIMNSYSNEIKIKSDPRKLFILKNDELKKWLDLLNINNNLITNWLYIPKLNPCMSKSRLWNFATKYSKSENLFFLDDDNYFISNNSINAINNLFNEYDVIFGQIKDSSNKLRAYSSNRVQGTTLGIKKEILM